MLPIVSYRFEPASRRQRGLACEPPHSLHTSQPEAELLPPGATGSGLNQLSTHILLLRTEIDTQGYKETPSCLSVAMFMMPRTEPMAIWLGALSTGMRV